MKFPNLPEAGVLTGAEIVPMTQGGVDRRTTIQHVADADESKASNIASAATTDLATVTTPYAHVTGTTTITAFGTAQAGARRRLVFDGELTLTHNASSLILPTGANIATAAGDVAVFVSEGSGNWRCVGYTRADGSPLAGSGGAAADVTYDNATSGLTATDVQAAIDELATLSGATKFVNIALSDMTTDLTTGAGKAVWFAPEAGNLVSVYTGVHDPSSSGAVTVDMNDSGGSVFTTLPSIDATEATSLTGTAAVLDGTVSFVRGDKFTFDIDAAGTDAKGLQICIEYAPT